MMKYNCLIKKTIRQLVPVMLVTTLLCGIARTSLGFPGQKVFQGNSETQQGIVVTGKVSSGADNTGLTGVSIVIKGTQKGTITNSGGVYSIDVSENNAVLIFSFIGFETTEVPVSGRKVIDITLNETIAALDEVESLH